MKEDIVGDTLIEVAGVSVFFPLYHGSSRSLKKTVIAKASGRLGQDDHSRVVVQALRDISFTLRVRPATS
jgi:lipopolysaccharide transport system ATP-binding protein